MKFTITGITGNTGSATASALLEAGHRVRALVRDTGKAESWADRGVELMAGELGDTETLTRALSGSDGAYLLVPPAWGAEDFFAAGAPLIDSMVQAVTRANVPRVVALSSIAVHLEAGTGPIRSLRPLEAKLGERPGVTFVRAAYFHENLASALGAAREEGVFRAFFDPDMRFHAVGTRDIGKVAAAELQVPAANAQRVVNLTGPEDVTLREIASLLGELVGKQLKLQELPPSALAAALKGMGAGHLAELYAELNEAMGAGKLVFETPPEIQRGHTSLASTLRDLVG